MSYEVRRAGDGSFYIVSVDDRGMSKEMYVSNKLLKFPDSEDAKDYIQINLNSTKKTRRV